MELILAIIILILLLIINMILLKLKQLINEIKRGK